MVPIEALLQKQGFSCQYLKLTPHGTVAVVQKFKLGDHVTWNSEAGHVSGRVIKIHTKNVNYKVTRIMRPKTTHNTRSRATRLTTSGAALKLVGRC
jgi:hypothetical protein